MAYLIKTTIALYLIMTPVTWASVHAPRQRNSPYVQTVRWYIYKTQRTKHPQSPICWYKLCPPVPASRPHYMEYWSYRARLYATSTSTSTSIVPAPPPMSQSLRALHRCVNIPPIATSVIKCKFCHFHHHFHAGRRFWLDSTYRLQLDLTHHFRLYLTHLFRLYLAQFF